MLNRSSETHPLSVFKRNTSRFLRQLEESGEPILLALSGKAELVVQSAQAYQRLLNLLDRLETLEGIRAGL